MKKLLIFIVLLLIPFIVQAETEFGLLFESEGNAYSFETYSLNDGYIISDYDGTKGLLIYYDKDGNKVKEISLDNGRAAFNLFIKDDYIYAVTANFTDGSNAHVEKYNKDLELLQEVDTTARYNTAGPYASYYAYFEIYNNEAIVLYDYTSNQIAIVNTDMELTSLDMGMNNVTKYLKDSYNQSVLINQYGYVNGPRPVMVAGDYYVVLHQTKICDAENIIYTHSTEEGTLFEDCYQYSITLHDQELNALWTVPIDEKIETFYNGTKVGDYIVLIGYSTKGSYIFVYDFEGNLIQEIENTERKVTNYVTEVDDGFAVTERCPAINGEMIDPNCRSIHMIYKLRKEIESATEGKGNVTVPANALAGETVTINVTPEKGYTLGELLVFDEEGHQIPVENNTFVMGTSKVTVRAVFVPENPNTGNLYVTLICLIAAITGIALVFQKKKLEFLK